MKFLVVVFFALAVFVATSVSVPAAIYDGPTYESTRVEDVDTDGVLATSTEETPIRHRRVTCDLLSFKSKYVTVNDAACAARCLAQRYRGGHCENGLCKCR